MNNHLEEIMDKFIELENLHESFSDALMMCAEEAKHPSYLVPLNDIIVKKIKNCQKI